MNKKEIISIIVVIILAALLIGIFAFFNKKEPVNMDKGFYEGQMSLEKIAELSTCPLNTDKKDDFAKCVTEKGWTMYGAVWCSHCKDQKELFGEAFQYIKYVECPDNIQLCLDKGVNGYPTWIVEK
jgi:hypothetical protein